ncbi:NAD(P)-binding protein [Dendrothele bispora CBS 962.96]|uniref:NAD(P)-binding protein n=1 Tax=Dendrothele bispora (strain CBS 962.96) TaxID=1314807 RepID=A0A4S8MIN7_DENBC|nr:NAD(P)-binding protein [Dendrothele bispora CBS 962.96]
MLCSQRIAVAGGTGRIGLHVVESLLSLKSTVPSLHIVVLSRTVKPDQPAIIFAGSSAPIVAVNYSDPSTIETVFRQHNIDTVISALFGDADVFEVGQENLLSAALNVSSIHRFSPSELSMDSETSDSVSIYVKKRPILKRLRDVKAVRAQAGIEFEYTKFVTGLIMNYFAAGNPKSNGVDAFGHMPPVKIMFDLKKGVAEIPGDGKALLWTSRIQDIGEFVAHATQLDNWPEQMDLVGDVRSLDEIKELIEQVLGRKLQTTYVSIEELRSKMNPAPTSSLENISLEGLVAFGSGEMKRSETYPGLKDLVRPMGLEEFLKMWWV